MSDTIAPLSALEEKLLNAIAQEQSLGNLDQPGVLALWAEICEDVPVRSIACVLPPVFGRLYRNDYRAQRMAACGLVPRIGNRALFWQALAIRIGDSLSHRDVVTESAHSDILATEPPVEAGPEAVEHLHEEVMKLIDVASSLEHERQALCEKNELLETALGQLRSDAAKALAGVLDNRADAIRGLARLAESSGLDAAATGLRRLKRLPFSPVAPPSTPVRRTSGRHESLSLMPSHQMGTPRDAFLNNGFLGNGPN